MAKYDDASWHYGGTYPKDLPNKNASIHIGMFLTWCIDNDLMSDYQLEETADDIKNVKNKIITGSEFLINNCDEKLTDEDLNELGNKFAIDYYIGGTEFEKQFGSYFKDYVRTFYDQSYPNGVRIYKSQYHIEDSWDNYELIKPVIEKRYLQWLSYT